MNLDFESCYRAVSSRDARFDGQFFTAVRTTGIYCRPSCPARTPKPENVTFHPTAASAQRAGFRSCKRCLPAVAPGNPRWYAEATIAARAMRLIGDGLVDREGVHGLAASLGYSSRQLTRILTEEMGAGPLALARAVRADRARQLVLSTALPLTDVAFAAGFASIRQFNDTMRELFGAAPRDMRRARGTASAPGRLTVRLPLRRPYGTAHMHHFLASHAVAGLEHHDGTTFTRVLNLPHGPGIAAMDLGAADSEGQVLATLTLEDLRDLGAAIARVRHLLDLDADPEAVDAALSRDPALAGLVQGHPGVRLPGAPDATELLIRTMVGQQISVGAARTHHSRLVRALGAPVHEPDGRVTHAFPAPAAIAESEGVLTGPERRVTAVKSAAAALADGSLALHQGMSKEECRDALLALPGVGPWTADYVTMRLLRDPDTLLRGDLILRRSAEALGLDPTRNDWSPWASYVTVRLMSPVS